jgi:hypothetical protein
MNYVSVNMGEIGDITSQCFHFPEEKAELYIVREVA